MKLRWESLIVDLTLTPTPRADSSLVAAVPNQLPSLPFELS